MIIVTEKYLNELLNKGISLKGAWNLTQLKAILPKSEFTNITKGAFPKKGWKFRLIGTKLKQAQIDEFLRFKNRHLAHKTREIPFEKPLESQIRSHMDSIRQEIKGSKSKVVNNWDCSKCIHGLTQSCTDRPKNGCDYFCDAKTDEHGPAYAA